MDSRLELVLLQKADEDIADAHTRIERQRRLIARLRQEGHPTAEANTLLDTLLGSLQAMEDHRGIILRKLGL